MKEQPSIKKDKKGYILVYKPDHKYSKTKNGWIFEHRAKTEDYLKRGLKPKECVHHLNELKWDNRIENLMIFKNHKEHSSWHNKLKRTGLTNPMRKIIKERWVGIK